MTRGRHRNVAHLVAESVEDARRQWVDVFDRDRADLGPGHATERAADDIDRYGPNARGHPPLDFRPRRSATAHVAHPHRSRAPSTDDLPGIGR